MRVLASLLLALLAAPAFGQSTTGDIRGIVTDQSGRVMAAAAVTVANTDTGLARTLVTDAQGRFAVPDLPAGPYELTATMSGYAPRRHERLRVRVGETITLHVELTIAAAADTLTVGGMPPTIEPTRSPVAAVVSAPAIEDLPVRRRSLADFVLLTPGVTRDVRSGEIAVAGLPAMFNNLVIDGADAGSAYAGQLSVEAVRELHVATANYTAASGRSAGAVVNVVTKSGTNNVTGSVFEFFGDTALNANTRVNEVFGAPKPPYRSHQFGGILSGPIVEDRHFFLVNYEGWRGTLDHDLFLARSDHQLGDPLRLALRYHQQGTDSGGFVGSAGTVLRPTIVNEARVQWADDEGTRAQIADTVTVVRGAHTLEAGVDLLFDEGAADDHAAFVQNAWQADDALTINTGLRIDDHVAPRLGLAWSPGRGRVLLRGGYGLFYQQEARAHHASAGFDWEWVPDTTVSATYLSVRADDLPHASRYNGVLAELHRRFWQGAHWRVAYSLGKTTDEHGAPAAMDHRHRFVASTVYTTDIWADRIGGWLEPVLKDFTLGVIWEMQSGQPDAAVAGRDPLRLPAYVTLDTRIARRIDLGNRRQLQLIWQAFNLRNRANYLTLDQPTQADPRRMELAARFLF